MVSEKLNMMQNLSFALGFRFTNKTSHSVTSSVSQNYMKEFPFHSVFLNVPRDAIILLTLQWLITLHWFSCSYLKSFMSDTFSVLVFCGETSGMSFVLSRHSKDSQTVYMFHFSLVVSAMRFAKALVFFLIWQSDVRERKKIHWIAFRCFLNTIHTHFRS